jgi:hypothetical protein
MKEIIDLLGLAGWRNYRVSPHHHHFHIDLHVPRIAKIGGPSLLIASGASTNQSIEGTHMLPMETPPIADIVTPPALIAHAISATPSYKAVLGACRFVNFVRPDEIDYKTAINDLAVLGPVAEYLGGDPSDISADYRITVLSPPKHGTIHTDSLSGKLTYGIHKYLVSDPDYRGKDQITFDILTNNKRFKVIFTIYVVGSVDQIPLKLENAVQ